jgi:hypothetical protein
MRIGAEAVSIGLLSETVQLFLANSAFQMGTGVNTGRGMALDVHQVAAAGMIRAPEKMVEADVVQ